LLKVIYNQFLTLFLPSEFTLASDFRLKNTSTPFPEHPKYLNLIGGGSLFVSLAKYKVPCVSLRKRGQLVELKRWAIEDNLWNSRAGQ